MIPEKCESCQSEDDLSIVLCDDNIYICDRCIKSLNHQNELLLMVKRMIKIADTLQMYAMLGSAVEKHYCNTIVEKALTEAKDLIERQKY